MPKKVILDVDPGIDDTLALCMALFDPRLDVLAVTAVAGNVPASIASRNVQALIEYLDPPRWPRIGIATDPDDGLPVDGRHMVGIDGLGGIDLPVAELRTQHPAEKIIADTIRAYPHEVTLMSLGPLTNVARAFQRDAELPGLLGELIMMGGAIQGCGNIAPVAEFNIFCDPKAARSVFQSRCTKTLIPLDVTNKISLSFDLFNTLPDESTRVGNLLRQTLLPAFRAYRQKLGMEGLHVHDSVALIGMTSPEHFTFEEMAGDVETSGTLTTGMTVFDRRRTPAWRYNMAVATEIDTDEVMQQILRLIENAGQCTAGK